MTIYPLVSSAFVTVCAFNPSCFLMNVSTSTSISSFQGSEQHPSKDWMFSGFTPSPPYANTLHSKRFNPNYTFGTAALQNNPTFRTVYPNKVFDYMSCARPVLLAIDGAARTLVCDEARAAVFAEPENAKAIAPAIRLLADHPETRAQMAANGRRWVLANASRSALAERYLDELMDLLNVARFSTHGDNSGYRC